MPINTGSETAKIRIRLHGAITAAFGVASHGQGLETTLAQIIADDLARDLGIFGWSRATATPSRCRPEPTPAEARCWAEVLRNTPRKILREKIKKVARIVEAAADDIDVTDGLATVTGTIAR